MSAINGTNLLLYSDGVVIAMQKGLSISVDTDLPDATSKESAGWARHIQGLINAKIDFSALFSTTVTGGMEANALMDYILSRQSLLVSILGLSFPMIGKVDMNSLSFDAPLEGTMSLSGSLKVNGQLFVLRDTSANLITDPDAGGTDYDTLTVSDIAITSAIKSTAGAKYCQSNAISVASTGIYKLAVFLTSNSGALPTVGLWDNTSAYISNTEVLVAGLNLVTLTCTSTDASASLRFSNTGNANWSVSPIYLWKV
jgi:hypothetical protein